MGQLDNTSVTDRPTSVPEVRPKVPAAEERDPGYGWFVFLAVGIAAAAIAAIVFLTSGDDEPTTSPRAYEPVRTSAVTATATTSPALPSATASAPAEPTTAGTPAPGTASAPAAGSTGSQALPAGWEGRTFQGVTFAVPPGATQPDLVDPGNADAPAFFSWTGPSLGGEIYSHISMWVSPASGAPTLGTEYQAITVPGADRAHMWTGPTGGQPASTTVDVHVVAGSRYINLTATVAAGAAGEQTIRDLVASLAVG
jgi:hypothetical protein